jgi:capsule biosynthesis phosphatase
MRICIDLDGTICDLKQPHESYADVQPKAGAKEMIQQLREDGHTIIIHTARNMATCHHNVGKVLKNVGKITLDWLEAHEIPYDEIFFGKPNADITIDDRVLRFQDNWHTFSPDYLASQAKER